MLTGELPFKSNYEQALVYSTERGGATQPADRFRTDAIIRKALKRIERTAINMSENSKRS
jgi:hypothetical protein